MGHFPFTTTMVRFHSAAYEENMFKFIFLPHADPERDYPPYMSV